MRISSFGSGRGTHAAIRGSRAKRRAWSGRRVHAGSRLRSSALILVTLYALVSTTVATATVQILHKHRMTHAVTMIQPKYLVLMVLDGARPDYFGLTQLPHLDALRHGGTEYTAAFDGILETETPAGHTAIATGSSPARNGILGFDWAQSDNDYSLFDPNVVRAGAMEHIMEDARVPTIASLFKKRYPNAKVVALSGHKYYAADPLGGPAADVIMYYQGDNRGRYVPVAIPGHTPPDGILNDPSLIGPNTHLPMGTEDHLATRLALATFRKMHQQITLINYPEFDWPVGHVDGGNLDVKDVTVLMRALDEDLAQIEDAYRRAGVLRETLFVITADHGMTPIRRFVPRTVITNAVSAAGTTAPDISYNTGTYVWLADTARAQQVAQNILKANDPGIQSVYYLTTVNGTSQYVLAGGSFVNSAEDAANQFLLSTLINGHEPTVVAFCKSGQTTSDPTTEWKGDHGGNNWQSQHIPLILSGAGIRPHQMIGKPAVMTDIAPTVLRAMGASPGTMEGHVLTDALLVSRTPDRRARLGEVQQLSPLAKALVAQDAYDMAHGAG